MKRSRLNRVGKIGRANIQANKKIAKVLADKMYCEVQLDGCHGAMFLTNAHRHKRSWYQGDVELLSDYKQVIRACANCHNAIENDAELTEEVFMDLRGKE